MNQNENINNLNNIGDNDNPYSQDTTSQKLDNFVNTRNYTENNSNLQNEVNNNNDTNLIEQRKIIQEFALEKKQIQEQNRKLQEQYNELKQKFDSFGANSIGSEALNKLQQLELFQQKYIDEKKQSDFKPIVDLLQSNGVTSNKDISSFLLSTQKEFGINLYDNPKMAAAEAALQYFKREPSGLPVGGNGNNLGINQNGYNTYNTNQNMGNSNSLSDQLFNIRNNPEYQTLLQKELEKIKK